MTLQNRRPVERKIPLPVFIEPYFHVGVHNNVALVSTYSLHAERAREKQAPGEPANAVSPRQSDVRNSKPQNSEGCE